MKHACARFVHMYNVMMLPSIIISIIIINIKRLGELDYSAPKMTVLIQQGQYRVLIA